MAKHKIEAREPGVLRRQKIVKLIRSSGYLSSADIAQKFGVSEETTRRDLAYLDQEGQVRRIRGGAVDPTPIDSTEPSRSQREILRIEAKREIAATLHPLINEGETIFFDVGTTVELAAQTLVGNFRGRAITTSLQVGMILSHSTDIEVVMIGGRVRPHEFTVHGSDALDTIAGYSADAAIIGCGGLTAHEGITDFTPGDIPLKRAMIKQSQRSYVLADSTKIGRVAVRHVCPLDTVDAIITDASIDKDTEYAITATGVPLLHS